MTNEQKIWEYLKENLNNNEFAVAGIMGNLQAESGLLSNNLQDSFEKKLGYTNGTYTAAVDNKTYTNFINDKAGYGLAQWTYPALKEALYKYAQKEKVSIGNLDMQLNFLINQLKSDYPTLYKELKESKIISESTNLFLKKYEMPADQSIAVQQKRINYAQDFYDKYGTIKITITQAEQVSPVANVKIGHASKDENGKYTGGAAGDQTEQEICIRDWYNKPWTTVFRPKNSTIAENIAIAMEQACANNNIGYDQSQRTTLYDAAKKAKWDLSKITTKCEADCSSLVAVCINAAGINISKDMNTNNELSLLKKTGRFNILTNDILSNSKLLKRGDILLGVNHTAIVLTNGTTEKSKNIINTIYEGQELGVATALTLMNVRNGAGTNYKIIGKVKAGEEVKVLGLVGDGWYKIYWPAAEAGYAYTSAQKETYYSYRGKVLINSGVITNFLVKILVSDIEIKKGPSDGYPTVGHITDKGVYTIIKTLGDYGFLKSGAGWIKLSEVERKS